MNRRSPGKRLLDRIFDLAIIGGGINGCGIARDAAGRGNSVFLCEMNDLASGTSSWSTKLVHGGLRYLEYYEFRLVREALIEREILWQIAPHIIRPAAFRFAAPCRACARPGCCGSGCFSTTISAAGICCRRRARSISSHDEVGKPLIANRYTKGFEYSDCFVDDARLVVLTARDAADRGAEIRTRSRAVEIRQVDGIWHVTVEDTLERRAHAPSRRARWSMPAARGSSRCWRRAPASTPAPRCGWCRARTSWCASSTTHDRAYMFQNADGRIVFVIPYQDDFTLIGTTDRDYDGDPAKVKASTEEIEYLCASVSEYLAKPVTAGGRGLDLFRRAPAL